MPFCTSAMTEQPTEQWVQTFLMRWTGWPWSMLFIFSAARALPGARPPAVPSAARPAVPSPACRRKPRRSSPPPGERSWYREARRCLAACPSRRLMSIAVSPRSEAVGAVEGLHVRRFAVARRALLGLAFLARLPRGHDVGALRGGGGSGGRGGAG